MTPLDKQLRSKLENTVKDARDIAEAGALAALQQLGVGLKEADAHLSDNEKELRRRLRAHGRQLGDLRRADGAQELARLTEEIAYEHWHRMLFARFLAENDLLMFDEQIMERETRRMGDGENGRIDAAKGIFSRAESEQELRDACALPGMPLEYLRFVRVVQEYAPSPHHPVSPSPAPPVSPSQKWTPAAGTFDGWPEQLGELKTLDPCCGSGHFLVSTFLMLVPMRMELEGLSAQAAVDAVLRENIHGLELDARCVELAAFALALTAWRYPEAGGYRPLPDLQVACSGLSISVAKEEWKQLPLEGKNLRLAMDWVYDTFAQAPVLGSLIDPSKSDAAKVVEWPVLQESLNNGLQEEQPEVRRELGIVAQGLTKAAQLLSDKYSFVLTNVPYLARGKQDDVLRDFCEKHPGKNDLATVFLDRCLQFCHEGGTTNVVLPKNWLFLTSYRKFRQKLLRGETWNLVARMGEGGFESSAAAGAFTILLTISRGGSTNHTKVTNPGDSLFVPFVPFVDHPLRGLDVSAPRTAAGKAAQLRTAEIKSVSQARQLENPDARISFDDVSGQLLENFAVALNGMHGADSPRFRFHFWETNSLSGWRFLQNTVERSDDFAGREQIFSWKNDGAIHKQNKAARIQGDFGCGKVGIAVSMMRELPVTRFTGEFFDISCSPIIPHNPAHLPAIWCFCSSPEYNEAVRRIDQKLNVTNATLAKVPFDLEHWTKVAEKKYPNGLPKPYSDDPTQWIFHGHPVNSDDPLQVAVARLLGYQWPVHERFSKGSTKDTKSTNEDFELSEEAVAKAEMAEALTALADEDGIVCIPAVRGEPAAADRLLDLLSSALDQAKERPSLFPKEFSCLSCRSWTDQLLTQAEQKDKSLEGWLRERFFVQHCKRFQHRPFVWHIWDGLHDGFAALVNYHKFDAKALETLIYTYLGDWISRCEREDRESGRRGEGEKTAAAKYLKQRLEKIAEGEPPYDIFVRWKPLEDQPLGWNPDLNDGVRLNIRPFMTGPDLKKKGAGILREKPNIHWKKDRGKDVASAPWFDVFGGERINDHHLTRAEKIDAGTRRRGDAGKGDGG